MRIQHAHVVVFGGDRSDGYCQSVHQIRNLKHIMRRTPTIARVMPLAAVLALIKKKR